MERTTSRQQNRAAGGLAHFNIAALHTDRAIPAGAVQGAQVAATDQRLAIARHADRPALIRRQRPAVDRGG